METKTREAADTAKPYGDVPYADPGYQDDNKKRYPIDTEDHVRAAWSYINKEANQSPYSAEQIARIKARIVSAGKKLGITFNEVDRDAWSGKSILDVVREVAAEDTLSSDEADLLLARLVRHVGAPVREAATGDSHTHTGPPRSISDHLTSGSHGMSASHIPDGAPAMHALHKSLHGGDIAKPPVGTKTKESQVLGDAVQLRERAIGADGIVKVKLIGPGWGSSGFYSPEVLERDGPKAFKAGTHMFFDHPSLSEERDRPEGSLKNLASVLVSDASYVESGPDGAGLYADAKVFSGYKDALEELAPHIGVSIRGDGKVTEGERDGKRGRIVEQISRGRSVDWVTVPGAGGKAVQLFEAVREGGVMPEEKKTETTTTSTDDGKNTETTAAGKESTTTSTTSTETKTTEAKRSESEQRLLERLAIRDARDVVTEILETKSNVPEPTAKRLKETLPSKAILNDDGELDDAAFRKLAEKAIDDEVSYVLEVSGRGRVRDMGGSAPLDEKAKEALKETREELKGNLVKLGLSEKAAELALSE